MPTTAERHLTAVPPLRRPFDVQYADWETRRVQDLAEQTHDVNPLIVAQEIGILLGQPVDVTDLVDLADALDDLAHSEDHTEQTLRQTRVDDATSKILRAGQCAASA